MVGTVGPGRGPAAMLPSGELRRVAFPHRRKGGRHVAGGPAGQTGMHADRRIEIGVGRRHDGGGGAGGQAGDVDAARIDGVVAHDRAGDAGDQRGLARIAPLIARAKPVPAFRRIGATSSAG